MPVEAIYRPSDWGALFHGLSYEEVLGAGAAGPGKTQVLIMDPVQQVMVENERCTNREHAFRLSPGGSVGWALHLRRTSPMLEQTIARTQRIFPVIDSGAHFDVQKTTWTFSSGYKYQFGHCKDPGDWDRYMSSEFTHIAYDELVQFDEEQYDQINTRLRTSDPVLARMMKIRGMSNPLMTRGNNDNFSVKDPNWVRKRFVDPAPAGRVVLKRKIEMADGTVEWHRMMYLPATLYDNPDPMFVKQYEKQLRTAKPHIRQALLFGNWYITMGSFFADGWNEKLHVCKPFNIPDYWPRFRSMDWGFKKPGCIHWFAMDDDGNLFCFKELTFQEKTDEEVADMVIEIEKNEGVFKNGRSLLTGPADTQLWEERGNSGKTKAQVFLDKGIPWVAADKKSRQRNAEHLMKRLKDHRNGTTTPGLVLFNTCVKAIQTLPSIGTHDKNSEEPADGGDDHWYDSVSYACAYASRGRAGIAFRLDDDDKDGETNEEFASRGRYGYGQH